MTLTNPSAVLRQFSNQLVDCPSWPAGMSTWYPSKPDGEDPPFAVLSEDARTLAPYAAGAGGIANGTLIAVLHLLDTDGNAEVLARALLAELLEQQAGVVFRGGECYLCADPSPGEIAGGVAANFVTFALTLPWGLSV